MRRTVQAGIALALAAILAVSVVVLANNTLYSARLDLTENALFTLSKGTREVLQEVPEPITMRLYYSSELANGLPQIKAYAQRVRELLAQYVTLAGGKLKLEVIDPEPFTDAEDEAVRAGLQAIPISQNESLYFGLVASNTVDDQEVISFFQEEKEPFLEYDLTRLVYNLSNPERPVVGLITAHQMNAEMPAMMRMQPNAPQPWAVVEQIRNLFDLRSIDAGAESIPEDVDLLLIAHPGELSEPLLYAIDQFVLAGGKAVVHVDPYSEVASAFAGQRNMFSQGPVPHSSDLPRLFEAWGIALEPGKIVADLQAAPEVNAGSQGNPRVMRYLAWGQYGPRAFDRADVVMAQLGPVFLPTVGSLKKREDATTEVSPLIVSGPQSMLMDAETVRVGRSPELLLENFEPQGNSHILAARVSGPVKSAFPEGPPAPEQAADEGGAEAEAEQAPAQAEAETEDGGSGAGETDTGAEAAAGEHLAESQGPINLIVVADSDMLFDQFWMRTQDFLGQRVAVPTAANADMLVNALDNLSGSTDLISLRSRGISGRPFEVLEALRLEAEQRFLAEEQRLREKLQASQERLNELQSTVSAGGSGLLTEAQQKEMDKLREELLRTRTQLRDVQYNLNRDIESLEARIKFANVGLVPILIALLASGLAVHRYRRRRRQVRLARQ